MDISQLVYRSVAADPPSSDDLRALLRHARRRNRQEGLTGLLVYDRGCFVQWLEGPPKSIERVWQSIRRDARHHDVERLETPWRPARLFSRWSMRLGTGTTGVERDALQLPEAMLQDAHAGPTRVAALIPDLALAQQLPPIDTLIVWCTARSDGDWIGFAEKLAATRPSLRAMSRLVFGPVARAIGDAWTADRIDSSDTLIAIVRMQSMLRRVAPGPVPRPGPKRSALVATAPGEKHLFGVSFAAMALDSEGWDVQCTFPNTTRALLVPLREAPFDVLHLALSDSFRREDRMTELAATIHAARRASLNDRLQVLLSGRAFAERPDLAVLLGADGDGLDQGSDAADLDAMLAYGDGLPQSPAAIAAQAELDGIVARIQDRGARMPAPERRPR